MDSLHEHAWSCTVLIDALDLFLSIEFTNKKSQVFLSALFFQGDKTSSIQGHVNMDTGNTVFLSF